MLWHLLWFIWETKHGINRKRSLIILILFMGATIIFYQVFLKTSSGLNWHVVTFRFLLSIILILIVQFALKAQGNISRLHLEKERLQTENYKAQLIALQSQVNPHFLFNALNTLRSMVRHQDANSEEFVMSLSNFFRQTLKHNKNTLITLKEELNLLDAYLFLMKSRNEKAMVVSMNVDKKLLHHKLPTLAVQTIVENCFKHNSLTTKNPLWIEITSLDKDHIAITNNKQPIISNEASSGRGLELLKKRYGLLNVDDGVTIEETQQQFRVQLKLLDS